MHRRRGGAAAPALRADLGTRAPWTGDHRTAVLSGKSRDEDAPCSRVTFVDLDGGRKTRENAFPLNGDGVYRPGVTLTRATVAVTRGRGFKAYDMDEGGRLWRTKATGRCWDDGAAGGRCWSGSGACTANSRPLRGGRPSTGCAKESGARRK